MQKASVNFCKFIKCAIFAVVKDLTMHLSVGTYLQNGRYEILRYISSGGFGCTYEARDTKFKSKYKTVAIKEFFAKDFCNRDALSNSVVVGTLSKKELFEKLRNKFIDEAEALYDLQHSNIVRVTDKFEENGTAYYVMDYIDGKSLNTLIEENGCLGEHEALGYIRQVAAALDFVHKHNRLHLDVKPHNIMIDGNGKAILIDFGVSKQYDEVNGENTSTLMGHTPGYAPIEQTGRGLVTFNAACDIYALGATLYKALTGKTPVDATLRAGGLGELDYPSHVSDTMRSAIDKAMQISRADRPQSIAEFLAMLESKAVAAADTLIVAGCSEEKTQVESGLEIENAAVAGGAAAVKSGPAQVKESSAAAGGASAQHSGAPKNNYSPRNNNEKDSPRKNSKAWIVILLLIVAGAAVWYLSIKGIEGVKVESGNKRPVKKDTLVSPQVTNNVDAVEVEGKSGKKDESIEPMLLLEPSVSIVDKPEKEQREEAERRRKEDKKRKEETEYCVAGAISKISNLGENTGYAQECDSNLTYNLEGRKAVLLPKVEVPVSSSCTVVVRIIVAPDGSVINAEVASYGTNTSDYNVRKAVCESARNSKFNKIDSNKNQTGTITYRL